MPKKLNAGEEWAEQTECLDHVVDFDLGLACLVGLAAGTLDKGAEGTDP